MINPKDCRENVDLIKAYLKKRGHDNSVLDDYIKVDKEWRDETQILESLQQERNDATPKHDFTMSMDEHKRSANRRARLNSDRKHTNDHYMLMWIPQSSI